jgi:DNA alkylation damage repair protein AlkB
MHKPMTIAQMLRRKLRWITLGGQYDWTNKIYPRHQPPPFPPDIEKLLRTIFPSMKPEAAIVNLYTPGDTLSVHRDVSEDCDRDLISVSIGCDALFLASNGESSSTAIVRLRSGDAILMTRASRYAWHAVPKVIANTCPVDLAEWPYLTSEPHLEQWKWWLRSKRINLNVRQMKES